MNLDVKSCPEYDINNDGSIESILSWANVSLAFSGPLVTIGGNPNKPRKKFDPYYTMCWKYGFMAIPYFSETDERWARMWSALFVYLWCVGVPASLADHLCCSHTAWRKRLFEERGI